MRKKNAGILAHCNYQPSRQYFQAAAKTILNFIVILSMLLAFYCHTSISFVLLYLFIFVRYFLTILYIYILTFAFSCRVHY